MRDNRPLMLFYLIIEIGFIVLAFGLTLYAVGAIEGTELEKPIAAIIGTIWSLFMAYWVEHRSESEEDP